MPFDPYIQKALLDWCTGAASVTRPTAWFLAFESGTPTYSGDSQAPLFRSTISFMPASTQAGGGSATVSNRLVVTCSPASSSCTVFGWAVWNLTSGGTRLAWGTLSANHSLLSGSGVAFAAANLKIILA
jgi:hypothetical protein